MVFWQLINLSGRKHLILLLNDLAHLGNGGAQLAFVDSKQMELAGEASIS